MLPPCTEPADYAGLRAGAFRVFPARLPVFLHSGAGTLAQAQCWKLQPPHPVFGRPFRKCRVSERVQRQNKTRSLHTMPPRVYGTSPTVQIGTVLSLSLSLSLARSLARSLSRTVMGSLWTHVSQEDETKRGPIRHLTVLKQYVYYHY